MDSLVTRMVAYVSAPAPPVGPAEPAFRGCASACSLTSAKQASLAAAEALLLKPQTKLNHGSPRR